MRTLEIGMSGTDVVELKTYLNYLGLRDDKGLKLNAGSNIFDVSTRQAVKRGQRKLGLVADGIYGPISQGTFPKLDPKNAAAKPVEKVDDGWRYVPSYKMDYQDTGYTCGPTSMSMGLTELFPGSGSREATLAKYAGTTTNGTPHSGLATAFMKELDNKGLEGEYYEKGIDDLTLEDIGKSLVNPDEFIIGHGNTKGWPSYWLKSYGHYVYLVGVNVKTGQFKIADPTKGVVTYSRREWEAGLRLISQKSYLFFRVIR